MPEYLYDCTECKMEITVYRDFGNRATPPTAEDLTGQKEEVKKQFESCPHHQWRKLISPVSKFLRGSSWGYSKGNP